MSLSRFLAIHCLLAIINLILWVYVVPLQICMKVDSQPPFDGLESFDNALSALMVVVLAILQQKYDHVFTGTIDTAGGEKVKVK